jgi:hypothetical protein
MLRFHYAARQIVGKPDSYDLRPESKASPDKWLSARIKRFAPTNGFRSELNASRASLAPTRLSA